MVSIEILESVDECEPLDGNMGAQQVQMRPLMELPTTFLATEYIPLELIGLNFCPNFCPIWGEKFSVAVKNET